eukprot:5716172-Pyramimonas_sp.AAC.1
MRMLGQWSQATVNETIELYKDGYCMPPGIYAERLAYSESCISSWPRASQATSAASRHGQDVRRGRTDRPHCGGPS